MLLELAITAVIIWALLAGLFIWLKVENLESYRIPHLWSSTSLVSCWLAIGAAGLGLPEMLAMVFTNSAACTFLLFLISIPEVQEGIRQQKANAIRAAAVAAQKDEALLAELAKLMNMPERRAA